MFAHASRTEGLVFRWLKRLVRRLVFVLVVALVGAYFWLLYFPPTLLMVATGYAAKMGCSGIFVSGRDPADVFRRDIRPQGHPIFHITTLGVNQSQKSVTARLFAVFAPSTAVYREGLGCTSVPDGNVAAARAISMPERPPMPELAADTPWPQGSYVPAENDPSISILLSDQALTGPGMRAVVVVKDGRIVGEIYGQGFDAGTRQLGWSMTKTVNAAIIGTMVQNRMMTLDEAGLFPEWTDGRQKITLADLLAMESGLSFNEDYGTVADVTRMLYLEPDMADFARVKPPAAEPGAKFNYSSGTAVLLSRLWMDRLTSPEQALIYPWRRLFNPLGMTSAVFEADEKGTYVGSSYLYATPRDWARFGLFLAQDGMWNGERRLPEGFVAAMGTPTEASNGEYTQLQAWKKTGDEARGLPADMFWLEGHDGQSVAVSPSAGLVVVRMGMTPRRLGYDPVPLVRAVSNVLGNR
jgi:CubicO group peptidase (beta-lactamase class C family)